MRKLLAALVLIVAVTGDAWADAARMAIGVLVGDGEHDALERWNPTADYLTGKIPEYRFVIVPLDREGMEGAVARHELGFVLTNPGQYAELAVKYGIVALATIGRGWRGESYALFGATIFARADRKDLAWMPQLRGKSFMATSRNDFDGFQLAWWELKAHDIDPFRDFTRLVFSSLPSEEIVYAVRDGRVDAATVHTGVLERMADEGKINLKEFRILHPHITTGYPFARSTELYPDWPFARAQGASEVLAQRVAEALQTMPADYPAARTGGYAGWTAPLDYQSVHELLKDLHLAPYEEVENITVAEIVHQYWRWLMAGLVLLLLLTGLTASVLWINRRLRLSKQILETEVAERARAEQALRRSEGALRELHDITATHSLSFEERVQALLALGCRQFNATLGVLARLEEGQYEVVQVVPPHGAVATGEALPLDRYCCGMLSASEPEVFDLSASPGALTHPLRQRCRLDGCLGITIAAQGKPYGTLNFLGPRRPAPPTRSDREVLKLMAQWLGSEIERQRTGARMHKLSSALEQTADAVMIVNRAGLIEYINPAFERISGYVRNEILGKSPRVLRSGRHGEEFYRRLWGTILRGEVFHDTFINRRKDGRLYYVEKTITPLKDEQGVVTHFISTGKDVTQRKLAEERARQRQAELAHVQRVSAMGVMATSLAHELNQPLAAIVNYARGCIHRLRRGDAGAELMTALEHIAAEGKRSGEIIRRVREFLRKGKPLRTRADINQIVHEAAELATLEARQKDIALRLELADGLPPVLADAVQIEQVVLNLVHNAIEAIDEAQCQRREVIVQTDRDPKNGVEVSVRDGGPGLPVRNPDHLFAPFFSTKSRGMGMGLSISRSIIEAHGASLMATTNADGGATFRFALPTVEGGLLQ